MIYLDHNATTPLDPRVLEAMLQFLGPAWANPSSPHRFGAVAREAVERARRRVAEAVGCRPGEIVFCASGTEADNLALRGVAQALRATGRHLVTTAVEHPAVLHTARALEAEGYTVTEAPVTPAGVVEVEALAASLRDDTILVSAMHVNNETGVIQPVEDLARLARARGVRLHTDAVQSAGRLPGALAALGADLVTLSAHKFHGPKGVAALYVRAGTPLLPVVTGGVQERGLRAGTENVAGIVGLAEALALAVASAGSDGERLRGLGERLEREVVAAVPRVRVNGAGAPRVPGTCSLSFADVDGESVVLGLDVQGICASTGSACSTGDPEPSHVLRAMGLTPREAQGTVRLSLGRETRSEDVDFTVRALVETVTRLRRISSVRSDRP